MLRSDAADERFFESRLDSAKWSAENVDSRDPGLIATLRVVFLSGDSFLPILKNLRGQDREFHLTRAQFP